MSSPNPRLKVVLVGGGSGGHITPLLAVARELKTSRHDISIIYIGESDGKFRHLIESSPHIDEIHSIKAGKFRRYHNESWLKRLLDIKTNLLNLRDFVYMLVGLIQSLGLVWRLKPNAIFIKGGFVGVPVGIAAAMFGKPFITHDSDTVPGLTNRIIGRWARLHATGLPPLFYNYPSETIRYVGVPISAAYKPVSAQLKSEYKESLKLPAKSRTLLITGGSQGAARLNKIVADAVSVLVQKNEDLYVMHQVGNNNQSVYEGRGLPARRVKVMEFISDLHVYSGAADLIIARAGATSIAEFALQGKACILVPHPSLTGNHQVKNALELEKQGAVIKLEEAELQVDFMSLVKIVEQLLNNPTERRELSRKISKFAKPNVSRELANVILEIAK